MIDIISESKNEVDIDIFLLNKFRPLIHWCWMMHIFLDNLTTIGSDNGLSSSWCQAIIWTNAGILLIGPLGTNFSEILIKIHTFSFKKMHLKMSSGGHFFSASICWRLLFHLPWSQKLPKHCDKCYSFWMIIYSYDRWRMNHDDVIKWNHFLH